MRDAISATSGLALAVKERISAHSGVLMRDNVHGLDIFADDPNVRIVNLSATGAVHAKPDPFRPSTSPSRHGMAASARTRSRDVILLLNYALMRPEPVAQIVFAFSAVEMLGQDASWSENQKRLLAELAHMAEGAATGSLSERLEVAEAIRKSVHRLTLRQGVLRLLNSLGLADLKKDWTPSTSSAAHLSTDWRRGLAPTTQT